MKHVETGNTRRGWINLSLLLSMPWTLALIFWAQVDVGGGDVSVMPTTLIFSHQLHIVENEMDCGECHSAAETSMTGADNLMPDMDVCADCHDVEEESECGTCHVDPEEPDIGARIEDYSKLFAHKTHFEAELECAACHAGMDEIEMAGVAVIPGMVACMDCHDQRAVSVECGTCHEAGFRLQPISHGQDFLHVHADLANAGSPIDGNKTCQTCHEVDYCQDCHQGDNLDRLSHPLNYEFTHALDAQANAATCVTCHAEQSFCVDCHRDAQLLPHTHAPGFVNNIPGDGGRHRIEAMNDLETCISCHADNAEEICETCHGQP